MESNMQKQMSLPGLGEPRKVNKDKRVGKKYGRLTIIEPTGGKTQDRKKIYKCKCDCGNIHYAEISNLKSENTKSCGCLHERNKKQKPDYSIDLTGEYFGKQQVIKENGRNGKGEVVWLLRCDCGREFSRVGRFLRKNPDTKRCPCERGKGNVPKRNIQKPRDNEQFAKDLYCMYIKEGWSIRDAAREEGYKTGVGFIKMFMEYIPGYKEESQNRRDNSKWARSLESCNKKSKIFRYESELQKCCVQKLKQKGEKYWENERSFTGFEIDITTQDCCYELKVTTPKKDIYRAMGQLEINAQKTKLKPVLVVPSDTEISQDIKEILNSKNIYIKDELSI